MNGIFSETAGHRQLMRAYMRAQAQGRIADAEAIRREMTSA